MWSGVEKARGKKRAVEGRMFQVWKKGTQVQRVSLMGEKGEGSVLMEIKEN